MNTVLVVGERPDHALALSEILGILGLEAIPSAREWKLAVRSLTSHSVDLILLDVEPGGESRQFFELLRELTEIPIVARTSSSDAGDAVWYLDHGAADYVSRKIASPVLAAKLKSLCKRKLQEEHTVVHLGNLEIDLDAYSVKREDQTIALTPIEFRLLAALVENVGKATSRRQLLERVWGEDFRECSHYLRLYIGYLRQKLEKNPHRPRVILTEWGYGYRLIAPRVPKKAGERRGLLGRVVSQD